MSLSAKSTKDSLKHLCTLLDNNKKVYFSRFGDGEILYMTGADNREHKANDQLRSELINSFTIEHLLFLKALSVNLPVEKGMIYGLFAPYPNNQQLNDVLIKTFEIKTPQVYESQVLFHYITVFQPKQMVDFLNKYIRPKRKMFIGSTPKHIAEKLFGTIEVYISTPPKNAYSLIETWFPEVLKHAGDVDVIIPSVGITSNIINFRLWQSGVEAHCLDIGSIVDATEGLGTRKWIRLMGHRVNNVLLPEFQKKSIGFLIGYYAKEIRFYLRLLYKGKKYKMPY